MFQDLKVLAGDCSAIADELLTLLSTCKASENSGKRETLRAAIKSMWKKSKIDETNARLEAIRDELQFRIIVSMKRDIDVMNFRVEHFQCFDEPKQKIIEAILDSNADLQGAISYQTAELLLRQDESDKLAKHQHQQIMSRISSMQTKPVPMTDDETRQKIIDRLFFNTMLDRDETIKDRHRHTFEWILAEDLCFGKPRGDFAQWLCTGDGIYWISGKAGSGKSTLMKFVRNDARTMQYLSVWAERLPLVVASCYFWKAGTHLQKSQAGLFRSLLHDVLEKCPGLSHVLFPKQYSGRANWDDFPTFNELKRAFQALLSQDAIKVVFFVDGLDEYEDTGATMSELSEMFKGCVSSSRIKVVIASRPLQPFEAAFRDNPKIRLHELTHDDIHGYVDDKLAQNPQMVELRKKDPLNSTALVNEVVESASGVFLWVRLIVRSLLEGLQSCDFISDLQRRLRELPRELEDLFQHMLLNIDPRYRMQSAQYLQIVRQYNDLPPDLKPHETGWPLCLQMFTYADYHITASWSTPPTRADMDKRCQETAVRLRARCVGLLELISNPRLLDALYDQPQERLKHWYEAVNVDYLHRSVLDFLERPAIWEGIIVQTSSTDFDACVVLMKVALHLLRSIDWDHEPVAVLIKWLVELANQVRPCSRQLSIQLLDNLDSIMAVHFNSFRKENEIQWNNFTQGRFENKHWSTIWPWDTWQEQPEVWRQRSEYHCSFLSFAARSNMIFYVQEKLGKDEENKSDREKTELLVFACDVSMSSRSRSYIQPSCPMIDLLLQYGADPNHDLFGFSPWQHVLYSIMSTGSRDDRSRWGFVVKRFMLHGANVQAYVGKNSTSHSAIHDHNWQYSALFVIKRMFLDDTKLPGVDWLDCWTHCTRRYIAPTSMSDELVQLMEERGAEPDMWRLVNDMGRRAWERVYPIPLSGQRVLREENYFGPVQENARPMELATDQLATEQLATEQPSAPVPNPPSTSLKIQPEEARARFKKLLHRRKK